MSQQSDEAIERRMAELRDLATDFAKAHAERTYLDEFRKSRLALLMKDAEVAGHRTNAGQEREGRAHPEYIQLLKDLRTATEIAEKSRWLLEIARIAVSVWQSRQSMKRAEMKGYGA